MPHGHSFQKVGNGSMIQQVNTTKIEEFVSKILFYKRFENFNKMRHIFRLLFNAKNVPID